MTIRSDSRRLGLAAAMAVLMAACSSGAPPPAPPPPPPPAKASVILAPRIIEQAAAYRRYVTDASAITPNFAGGDEIAAALETSSAYEPGQLARGAMAYAAVVALQDPAFVSGVRIYAKDSDQRRQVVYELLKNPAYAIGFKGSASAAGLVVAALGGDAQRLYDDGKLVKQAAYDLQKQSWSKAEVADRAKRLARAKELSGSPMLGNVGEGARLQQAAASGGLGITGAAAQPPYTTTVTRSLAIAALAILGEADEANVSAIQALMVEPNVTGCMRTSKLNLYQCLAVARPHYEDVFCMGQHAMMDTGRCVIRASGLPEPYEARFVPDASSIAKTMKPKKPPAKKRTAKR